MSNNYFEFNFSKKNTLLITNYHVPFIYLEFAPKFLVLHETDPIQFLEMLEINGYKFPKYSFLDNNYYTKQEIMEKTKNEFQTNLYVVYSNLIKSDKKNITNNPYI